MRVSLSAEGFFWAAEKCAMQCKFRQLPACATDRQLVNSFGMLAFICGLRRDYKLSFFGRCDSDLFSVFSKSISG